MTGTETDFDQTETAFLQRSRQGWRVLYMSEKMTARALVVASLTVVSLAVVPAPTFAHHGTGASYDQDKTIAVKGKVTEFAWKNPHSALFVDVTDGPFKGKNYAVELNSPGVMVRQ